MGISIALSASQYYVILAQPIKTESDQLDRANALVKHALNLNTAIARAAKRMKTPKRFRK